MTPSPGQQPSWALDIPGLGRSDAERLASFVRDSGVSEFATAVDPGDFLTLHLDRDTARSLLQAISLRDDPGRRVNAVSLEGLSEVLTEWLS
jgi:hypothetical protein